MKSICIIFVFNRTNFQNKMSEYSRSHSAQFRLCSILLSFLENYLTLILCVVDKEVNVCAGLDLK